MVIYNHKQEKTMTTFNTYIDTLIEEKGIDTETAFEFENENGFNLMTYAVVVNYIKNTSKQNQEKIKKTLTIIDFKNGKIEDFIEFLGKGIKV
jgi:hypothetical protein